MRPSIVQKLILSSLAFTLPLCAIDTIKGSNRSSDEHIFTFESDYVALFQGHTRQDGDAIVSKTNGVTSAPQSGLMKVGDLKDTYTNSVQAVIRATDGDTRSVEFRFLGIANWRKIVGAHSGASIMVTNFQNSGDLTDWVFAANAEGNYTSHFNVGDAALWFHTAPRFREYFCVSWSPGLRYLYFADHLKMTSQRLSGISRAHIRMLNRMAGAMLGGEFQCNPTSFLTWTVIARGGLYVNFIRKNSILKDNNDTTTVFNYLLESARPAYSIEANPIITVNFSKYLHFNIGYQGYYIADLARAPLQIGPSQPNDNIKWKSSYSLQAATIGLGASF